MMRLRLPASTPSTPWTTKSAVWSAPAGARGLRKWAMFQERLRHAREERATRAELRRAHADSGAVAQLVGLVEQVDHREPEIDFPESGKVERLDQPQVHVGVPRQVLGVGKAFAQSASIEPVDAQRRAAPLVREPARDRDALVVIEVHPVRGDVVGLVWL